jgi:hypothetical protein
VVGFALTAAACVPGATIHEGRIGILFRVEDNTDNGNIGRYTSHIGMATSDDGVRFNQDAHPYRLFGGGFREELRMVGRLRGSPVGDSALTTPMCPPTYVGLAQTRNPEWRECRQPREMNSTASVLLQADYHVLPLILITTPTSPKDAQFRIKYAQSDLGDRGEMIHRKPIRKWLKPTNIAPFPAYLMNPLKSKSSGSSQNPYREGIRIGLHAVPNIPPYCHLEDLHTWFRFIAIDECRKDDDGN